MEPGGGREEEERKKGRLQLDYKTNKILKVPNRKMSSVKSLIIREYVYKVDNMMLSVTKPGLSMSP